MTSSKLQDFLNTVPTISEDSRKNNLHQYKVTPQVREIKYPEYHFSPTMFQGNISVQMQPNTTKLKTFTAQQPIFVQQKSVSLFVIQNFQ